MPARALQESSPSTINALANDIQIEQFTATVFDPIAFLNDSLPTLSFPPAPAPDQARLRDSSVHEVSAQTRAFLNKVNAQNLRFASTLSHLTDEILRSGSRLAYEAEVLRADANALYESLTDTLQEDIGRFTSPDTVQNSGVADVGKDLRNRGPESYEPESIGQLRMLEQVKARLEEVINVFGEAMKWPLPPSELSLTSSLISVSAPEPGSESHSREEKGKQFAKKARGEVVELLSKPIDGRRIDAAATKVDALRLLSTVWKGTSEERARNKLVENLGKLVEDKRRHVEARSRSQSARGTDEAARQSSSTLGRPSAGTAQGRQGSEAGSGGGGLFRNLQRLRDEIYLD
jgi:hypothetical protein